MSLQPQIVMAYDQGAHNSDLQATDKRLEIAGVHKDLSTIIVIPTISPKPGDVMGAMAPIKASASWTAMMTPPNQKVVRLYAMGLEVGAAYNTCIEQILAHPDLKNWKYLLTIEHDNIVPPDGLVKLLERMEANQDFDVIGGLYFTKGEGGVAQIWGNPYETPINFKPQKPRLDGGLQPCCGTGMGFTLYRLSLFKDERLRRPWFQTTADTTNGMFTQDLFFAMDAAKFGKKFGIDCGVKVGHYDVAADKVW